MPLIKLNNIVSFSSEDKIHKAENLLKCKSDAKWKCESANEKQLSVVIQLEKSVNISKIEIGNEGSAFIEVLVSRAESSTKEHCLLPVTSFMNPNESKEKSNMNRVKIFNSNEHLTKEIAEQKWDRVKIVCTQPFNKTIQYGLSFVKFYSPGDKEEEKDEESQPKLNTGIFSLKKTDSSKNDNDGDDNVKVGSTFSKWKSNKDDKEDVEMSKAKDDDEKSNKSDESEKKESKQKTTIKKTPSNESKKDDETKKEPLKKQTSKRKKQSDDDNDSDSVKEQSKPVPKKQTLNTDDTKKPVAETKKAKSPERETKKTKSPEKETKDKKTIMKGVVFVLSGFQNPQRSDLRDKAIELGAKYKPDWDKDCTHLVCAFKDTPKYIQVKNEGGKIVKKEWVLDCHSKSKLLDIKDYQFKEEKRRNRDESDDEEDDEDKKRATRRAATTAKRTIKKTRDDSDEDFESENSEDRDFIVNSSEEDEEYEPTESEDEEASLSTDSNDSDSDSKSKKKKKKNSKKSKDKKKKTSKKKKGSSSDSDSSGDEKPKKKTANKKKNDSSDSDDDSDKKQKNKKQAKKKEESSDSEPDNKKKPAKQLEKSTKKKESSDDDDKKENDKPKKPFLGNDDVTPKHLPKSSTNNAKKKIEYDSDSDDDTKKKAVNNKTNNKNSNNNGKDKKVTKDDSSTSSTDVNSDLDEKNDKEPWELPDLFLNKNFFIYGDYSVNDRKLLTRMIVAYGGVLHDYWTNDIDFVITDREWNDEFEKSQKENPNLKFVNGDWLNACVKRKKLIAYEPFAVYPSV